MPAPIALFVYNRPDHTRRTIDALARNVGAEASDLFVFSDAPRSVAAEAAVAEVRALLRTVTGFRSVEIVERHENWGLRRSIVDGVTRLCDARGDVIVVEDDLVTSPWFLDYMNAALDRYRDEPRVMQVAGHMFPIESRSATDATFLSFTSSWGWSTWKRAWDFFDPAASGYASLRDDAKRRRSFDLNDSYPFFAMLEDAIAGRIDSWAIRWYLSVFDRDGLVLFPRESLVENLGFDGTGLHCDVSDFAGRGIAEQAVHDLPPVVLDQATSRALERYFTDQQVRGQTPFRRLWSRTRAALTAYRPLSDRLARRI